MTTQNLLVELFVEELPPKALKRLGEAFAELIRQRLGGYGLLLADSVVTAYASPRRLAAHITHVASKDADAVLTQKVLPTKVGMDAHQKPSDALKKKLASFGLPADMERLVASYQPPAVLEPVQTAEARMPLQQLFSAMDGNVEMLFYKRRVPGKTLADGLQQALSDVVNNLPIPKLMTYQLADGWSDVKFVRPAHGLVALHGSAVVPVEMLGLKAGNTTHGHRFEALQDPITLPDADSYADKLLQEGAVIASFAQRRAEIVRQLAAAAAKVGGGVRPIDDAALLDEVTALVERPNVLVCSFERAFLEVPQECLILTMKANQKYFPLLDAQGKLTHQFLVVSNISPQDPSAVIGGNERVIRPRLADAKFFYDQDRKKTLASRAEGLAKVVYHNKLGSQAERAERVRDIAHAITEQLRAAATPYTAQARSEFDMLAFKAEQAARLAKADLLTDMVGEFPELQGIMGGYYARHEGLRDGVAIAIEDHYKPRFAGDSLPRNHTGLVVALADKLETLVGMFGIGNLPTGDRDPFALRRHALGVIRILMEQNLPLPLDALLASAVPVFGALIEDARPALADFMDDRLAGLLREQGFSAQEVDAVLSLRPQRLGEVPKRLAAVRAFAALPEAPALAAANKRVGNILKKSDAATATLDAALLQEPAEIALHNALESIAIQASDALATGQYGLNLALLAALKAPVDAFFEQVMVNAEDPALRANRLALLARLHAQMNRVADLSRLAT